MGIGLAGVMGFVIVHQLGGRSEAGLDQLILSDGGRAPPVLSRCQSIRELRFHTLPLVFLYTTHCLDLHSS